VSYKRNLILGKQGSK